MHAHPIGSALAALLGFVSIAAFAPDVRAQEPAPTPAQTPAPSVTPAEPEREKHPFLMYIPNRIFDVFDIVRLRVRVGPGTGVSARATEVLALTLGGYTSLYAGIPGPRKEPRIPWPIGVENFAGAQVSVAGSDVDKPMGPRYGAFEVEAGFHLLLLGVDVGVDAKEAVDLVLGFLTLDIGKDDY
jgi:hypothetical protein